MYTTLPPFLARVYCEVCGLETLFVTDTDETIAAPLIQYTTECASCGNLRSTNYRADSVPSELAENWLA